MHISKSNTISTIGIKDVTKEIFGLIYMTTFRGLGHSSAGRAPAWHAGVSSSPLGSISIFDIYTNKLIVKINIIHHKFNTINMPCMRPHLRLESNTNR